MEKFLAIKKKPKGTTFVSGKKNTNNFLCENDVCRACYHEMPITTTTNQKLKIVMFKKIVCNKVCGFLKIGPRYHGFQTIIPHTHSTNC